MYKIYSGLRFLKRFWADSSFLVRQGYKSTRLAAWFDRLICFVFYGADFSNYVSFHFYDLNRAGRNRFITYFRNEKLWKLFSKSAHKQFLDKASFNEQFNNFIHRKWIDTRTNCLDRILDFIKTEGNVIVKPVDSCMGKGIHMIDGHNNEDLDAFIAEINAGHHYLVEEILQNVPEIRKINPPSLNTIRVITCLDKDRNVHILASCLRAGVSDAITDNVCTGG